MTCCEPWPRLGRYHRAAWALLSLIGGDLAVVLPGVRIRRSLSRFLMGVKYSGRWADYYAAALLRERALEEARVRSSANLILAITAVVVLQAGLCPALCFARSAGPDSSQLEHASAPEKAPCHEKSDAPSSSETPEDCEGDCSRFDGVALATSHTRAVLDAPAVAFAVKLFNQLPPASTVPVGEFELALAPPPRNLLLVKNSFLI